MKAFANFKNTLQSKYGSAQPAQLQVQPNDAPLLPADVERSTPSGQQPPLPPTPPPPASAPTPPPPASASRLTPTGPPPPGGAAPSPAPAAQPPQSAPQAAAPPQAARVDTAELARHARIWQLNYYKRFFDVDTVDVRRRLLMSVNPLKYNFLNIEQGQPRPDLYGPLWVSTTLVFLLAAVSNVDRWVRWDVALGEWQYDLTPLPVGGSIIGTYIVLFPFILFLMCKWFSAPVGLVDLISLFGYSMTAYAPGIVLCLAPQSWARWLILGAAFALSLAFLVGHLFKLLLGLAISKQGGLAVLASALIFHTGFFLVARLYFLA